MSASLVGSEMCIRDRSRGVLAPLGGILGHLGGVLGRLGALLGASWHILARLGASWSRLGAVVALKKTCHWQRTGSALKRKPNARLWGTSRTIDVLKKSFEKSLGIILETSCAIGNTYSELRRFAAHSRERECPHANASWNVSRRPKIPPRAPKTPQTPPRRPIYYWERVQRATPLRGSLARA